MGEDYSQPNFDDSGWEWTTFTKLAVQKVSPPDAIWLRKRFDLNPPEACVRYFLRCDDSAIPMIVYLRGQKVAETDNDSHLDIDVTDELSLDDNVLVLKLELAKWNLDSQTQELYLQPIFCDDLG